MKTIVRLIIIICGVIYLSSHFSKQDTQSIPSVTPPPIPRNWNKPIFDINYSIQQAKAKALDALSGQEKTAELYDMGLSNKDIIKLYTIQSLSNLTIEELLSLEGAIIETDEGIKINSFIIIDALEWTDEDLKEKLMEWFKELKGD